MKKIVIIAAIFLTASTAWATDACTDYEIAKKAVETNQPYEIWMSDKINGGYVHISTAEEGIKYWEPKCKKLRLPGARIGMTAKQIQTKTSWGAPESVNRTTTKYGTREQWVYGNGRYLYFENGKLTAIQN